jgi:hypothetical protein
MKKGDEWSIGIDNFHFYDFLDINNDSISTANADVDF